MTTTNIDAAKRKHGPIINFTADERRSYLRKGCVFRAQRACVLRDFADGRITFAEIYSRACGEKNAGLPRICAKIPVKQIIRAKKGFGVATTERLMYEIGIAPNRRVGGLGYKQAAKLTEALDA